VIGANLTVSSRRAAGVVITCAFAPKE